MKYIQLIEQGNISWEGCKPEYYTYEYIIHPIDQMIGTKFSYLNWSGKIAQAVVYLNTITTLENDMEAEINNIRRQVNSFRKDMGLKIFNKVEIIFEHNEYWSMMNDTLMNMLTTRLVANITFSDKLDEFKLIETFNGKEIKVYIQVL
jgi:superoxide dismutase